MALTHDLKHPGAVLAGGDELGLLPAGLQELLLGPAFGDELDVVLF